MKAHRADDEIISCSNDSNRLLGLTCTVMVEEGSVEAEVRLV